VLYRDVSRLLISDANRPQVLTVPVLSHVSR
jgi:hypothetical protein